MDDSQASLAHLYIPSQNLTGRAEDGKTEQQETQVMVLITILKFQELS